MKYVNKLRPGTDINHKHDIQIYSNTNAFFHMLQLFDLKETFLPSCWHYIDVFYHLNIYCY